VFAGASPGTWIASNPLSPGDSYQVTVYSPHPTRQQLARAGNSYPDELAGYRTIELPLGRPVVAAVPVRFPAFHSRSPVLTGPFFNQPSAAAVEQSPYGRAFVLARRLAARAPTPYAFVTRVQRYLANGFAYDETPPQSKYPLETFLFRSKLGYCQQFAGAMALLLRMGGIPARVAAGFTTGVYDAGTKQWVVSDVDAHAWVEAWFPHYGWVRFDPTPAADPALGGRLSAAALSGLGTTPGLPKSLAGKLEHPTTSASTAAAKRSGGISALLVIALVVAALATGGLAAALWRAGAPRGIEQLLAELERAMSRTGRPIAGGMTLAGLERRVRGRPDAEAYIRTLRLARFGAGSGDQFPTLRQRRALRAELRAGLGVAGALRALWALPPRWARPGKPA
jgi:hypothetical protein